MDLMWNPLEPRRRSFQQGSRPNYREADGWTPYLCNGNGLARFLEIARPGLWRSA